VLQLLPAKDGTRRCRKIRRLPQAGKAHSTEREGPRIPQTTSWIQVLMENGSNGEGNLMHPYAKDLIARAETAEENDEPVHMTPRLARKIAEAIADLDSPSPPLPGEIARIDERVGWITTPRMQGDNLSVTLCAHFDNADQEEDENGWTPDAIAGCEEVLAAIRAHYASVFSAYEAKAAECEMKDKALTECRNIIDEIAGYEWLVAVIDAAMTPTEAADEGSGCVLCDCGIQKIDRMHLTPRDGFVDCTAPARTTTGGDTRCIVPPMTEEEAALDAGDPGNTGGE
jgi:hypothetical protein